MYDCPELVVIIKVRVNGEVECLCAFQVKVNIKLGNVNSSVLFFLFL